MTPLRGSRCPHRRRVCRRNDAGSMPLALLVTLVGISLSALLAPMVLNQLQSTRIAEDRSAALHAAQAGLDVALGQILAARNEAAPAANEMPDTGRRDGLPCGPLTGAVPGGGRYLAEVHFVMADPAALLAAPDSYAAVTTSPDRVVQCVPGRGIPVTPAFAVLFSWGNAAPIGAVRDGAGSRRLQASYRFRTTNENILGGLIRVRGASDVELCLDAGSALPAPGAKLRMQPCQSANGRQLFAYLKDLTVVLTASQVPQMPLGMCLDAPVPHTVGALVELQPCAESVSPAQQWSINDVANFVGTTDGVNLDGYCFNVQNPDVTGSPVVLARGWPNCDAGTYDNKQTFQPDPAVGAGAAGEDVGQVVNFKQFGRCLDVTDRNPSQTYLIAWPCKQAPDARLVSWNQKWRLPAVVDDPSDPDNPTGTGAIVTTSAGADYCLQKPPSTTYGSYPRVVVCPAGAPPENLTWTVYGKTKTYATSYQIQAGPKTGGGDAGTCLAAANPDAQPPELYDRAEYRGSPISKIVVRPCDGSAWQKWNAPAYLLDPSPLKDFAEK